MPTPKPLKELEPHYYTPSAMHMGDCQVCGHLQGAPIHSPEERSMSEYTITVPPPIKYSDWRCWLFGSSDGSGLVWRPLSGQEPNWFWRKMQYLCFGNRWVLDPKKE